MRPRRGTTSLSGSLNADRKDREQIRRLVSKSQKPADGAPAPPGTGVIGMSEVWTSSLTLSAAEISLHTTWDTPYPVGPSGASVTASGDELVVPAGYYSLTMSFGLWWDTEAEAPPYVMAVILAGDSASYNNGHVFKTMPTFSSGGGKWGVEHVLSHGPAYIRDGYPIRFEVRPMDAAGNTTGAPHGNSGGFAAFNISKLT